MHLQWRHYAIECWGLGTFMLVAGAVAIGLGRLPAPFSVWLTAHPLAGRALFGCAMGATAAAIIYSPWGARSGAHLNPSVTLTFACLGKIRPLDAAAYIVAQFVGAALGLWLVALIGGALLLDPPTHGIATMPGQWGVSVAFAAETAMTFVLMTVVLHVSNAAPRIARLTGLAAATLVALYITFEAPLSGMSMNPARSLASALVVHDYTALWVYFIAPPLGMLLAALAFVTFRRPHQMRCGRLNHGGDYPCIAHCATHPGS